MNETISIVVPVYNRAAYIGSAVESVLQQSYGDWELILVDDGSTDGSGSLCEKLAAADERVAVFHSENGGVSHARNLGLSHACGEYVMFLDADDTLLPDALQTLAACAADADLVVGGIQMSDGRVFRVTEQERSYESAAETAQHFDSLFANAFYSSPCSKLYRRKAITARFSETDSYGEDVLFNLDFLESCGRIRVIPQVIYFYRLDVGDSLTKAFVPQIDRFLSRMFDRVFAVIGDTPLIRRTMSYSLMDKLLTQTIRLMHSGKSFAEKHALIKAWSSNQILNDERIDPAGLKNEKHRIMLHLYRTGCILCIMMLCR